MASNKKERKKLRPLVITMGGQRKAYITEMFKHPELCSHFESPTFSPGIPSRHIRNRKRLLHTCYLANLLSDEEWENIENDRSVEMIDESSDDEKNISSEIHIRKGRKRDINVPYSVELWRKAKSLGRGRSVFACLLAHLIAMRKSVEDEIGFDIILEDNVRPVLYQKNKNDSNDKDNTDMESYMNSSECANRIRDTMKESVESGIACHLRYYGWLGSIENVQYIYNDFIEKDGKLCKKNYNERNVSVFSFPITAYDNRPGTSIWGAYAYWISPEGYYKALIPALRADVGSMLWKSKRMRGYLVKPIDKVMPRKIIEYMASIRKSNEIPKNVSTNQTCMKDKDDNEHSNYNHLDARVIHVTTHPAFYRAPMLTSTIHKQWDVEFCKSTEVQFDMQSKWFIDTNDVHNKDDLGSNLNSCRRHIRDMTWDNLWLTNEERESVKIREEYGTWDEVEARKKRLNEVENQNWDTTRNKQ